MLFFERKWFMKEIISLTVLWCIGIVLNLHCVCVAVASKSSNSIYHARGTNLVLSVLANVKSSKKAFHFHDHRKRRNNETEKRMSATQSNNLSYGSDITRTLNSAKLKKVGRLLEKALDGLKECSQSAPEGGILKLKDKSPKQKPSLCCFPCGCGGCCLMRPMIMYKVKYTPPKFKMKPLKSKTKCGCPHYGIHLGKKRR